MPPCITRCERCSLALSWFVRWPVHVSLTHVCVRAPRPGQLTPGDYGRMCVSLMVLCGLYFGVLTRDIAEVCTQNLSAALGLSKKGDNTLDMSEWSRNHMCALCGLELNPNDDIQNRIEAHHGHRGGGGARQRKPKPRVHDAVFELKCGHKFHESCIRGESFAVCAPCARARTCLHTKGAITMAASSPLVCVCRLDHCGETQLVSVLQRGGESG